MINSNTDWKNREYTGRAATLGDADMIVDLINAASLADAGLVATNREEKLIEWGLPQFHMKTDAWLLLGPDGRAAGYVELWDSEPHVRPYLWGRVHPDFRNRGLGGHLMGWAEARARRSLAKAPPEACVSVVTNALEANRAAHELFERRGYAPARHFFHMLIEMLPTAPPAKPVWPEGVTVRPYAFGPDDRSVHHTIDAAFQDHWGYVQGESFEEWFHWIEQDPAFDPSICFLAEAHDGSGKQPVGVLMARHAWEEDPSIAWIDELGVLREWRHKGIGLALLQQALGEFYRRSKFKVGLGVDGASLTGALRLYEKAGMHVFRQIDVYEKVLRPGRDISTQSL